MSIRIFKSALIHQQLGQQELDDLAADFLSYKKDGVLPDTFGRDAPYGDDRTYPLVKEERWPTSILRIQMSLSLSFYVSSNEPAIRPI